MRCRCCQNPSRSHSISSVDSLRRVVSGSPHAWVPVSFSLFLAWLPNWDQPALPCTVYTDVENKRSIPWNETLQFQIISFHNRIALTGAVFLPQFYNISFIHLYIFSLYTYPLIFRFLSSNTFTTWVLMVNLHTVAHQGGQNWWIFNSCVSVFRITKEKRGNL